MTPNVQFQSIASQLKKETTHLHSLEAICTPSHGLIDDIHLHK